MIKHVWVWYRDTANGKENLKIEWEGTWEHAQMPRDVPLDDGNDLYLGSTDHKVLAVILCFGTTRYYP